MSPSRAGGSEISERRRGGSRTRTGQGRTGQDRAGQPGQGRAYDEMRYFSSLLPALTTGMTYTIDSSSCRLS